MVVAVERGSERIITVCAHHLRNGNVGIQAYVLVDIAIEATIKVGDIRGKCIPVVSTGDDVGILLRTLTGEYLRHLIPLWVEDECFFVKHQRSVGRIVGSGAISIGVPSF